MALLAVVRVPTFALHGKAALGRLAFIGVFLTCVMSWCLMVAQLADRSVSVMLGVTRERCQRNLHQARTPALQRVPSFALPAWIHGAGPKADIGAPRGICSTVMTGRHGNRHARLSSVSECLYCHHWSLVLQAPGHTSQMICASPVAVLSSSRPFSLEAA